MQTIYLYLGEKFKRTLESFSSREQIRANIMHRERKHHISKYQYPPLKSNINNQGIDAYSDFITTFLSLVYHAGKSQCVTLWCSIVESRSNVAH